MHTVPKSTLLIDAPYSIHPDGPKASHLVVDAAALCQSRVQTPGYIPKETQWVFWVYLPKKNPPIKPTNKTHLN